LLQRRVENQAIELDMVGLLLGLSLNRRNEQAKDKAQDCKTLHRSSPFLSCVHSGRFVHASVLQISRRTQTSVRRRSFRGVNEQHLTFAASEFPDE